MNIDRTTLFFIFFYPPFSAGPQKPQTLTASKSKYEESNFDTIFNLLAGTALVPAVALRTEVAKALPIWQKNDVKFGNFKMMFFTSG